MANTVFTLPARPCVIKSYSSIVKNDDEDWEIYDQRGGLIPECYRVGLGED